MAGLRAQEARRRLRIWGMSVVGWRKLAAARSVGGGGGGSRGARAETCAGAPPSWLSAGHPCGSLGQSGSWQAGIEGDSKTKTLNMSIEWRGVMQDASEWQGGRRMGAAAAR